MKIRIIWRILQRAMSEIHLNQIKVESLGGRSRKQWLYFRVENWYTQLTLEQHRFELCGSTYTQIFFNTYYSTTWSAAGWIHRCEYQIRRAHCKVFLRFLAMWRVTPLTPILFNGQLYTFRWVSGTHKTRWLSNDSTSFVLAPWWTSNLLVVIWFSRLTLVLEAKIRWSADLLAS